MSYQQVFPGFGIIDVSAGWNLTILDGALLTLLFSNGSDIVDFTLRVLGNLISNVSPSSVFLQFNYS